MQRTYTLDELSKFLKRPTRELKKLAEKELLKGRKVQGDWLFSLPDVVLWMENEMTQVEVEQTKELENAVASVDQESQETISLSSIIDVNSIELQFSAKTKASVINELAKIAENTGKLWDVETMTQALQEREEMASTALDNGVAILHPRRPQPNIIAEDFLVLAISQHGIPFGGGFNNNTSVFFLLCCQSDTSYLRSLGRLARVLKTPNFLDDLMECATPVDVIDLIAKTESELV